MTRFQVSFNIDITDGSSEDLTKWLRDALEQELILHVGERVGIIEVQELGTVQE